MLRIPSLVRGLTFIVFFAALVLPRSARAAFAAYGATVNSTAYGGTVAPYSTGPIPVVGTFGATGTGSASIDRGIMKSFASVSNPVTGANSPHIDVDCQDLIKFYDTSCPTCPYDASLYPVVMHTRLTGHLLHSGSTPYVVSIRLTMSTGHGLTEGTATLDASGLTTTGVLSGAPADLDGYPVDFPLLLNLGSLPAGSVTAIMETKAGGTASGTEVNTATADFDGVGWQVEPVGPVFGGLPPGVTVDIPSLNIQDNRWRGPTTGVANGALSSGVALHALQNPARGLARLSLSLPAGGLTRVDVFDVAGSRVATLVDDWQPAGAQVLEWNTSRARAGIYFARVSSNGRDATARFAVAP